VEDGGIDPHIFDNAMAQVVTYQNLTKEAQIQLQASPRVICGGQSGKGAGLYMSTSIFPRQYQSTSAPYSYFICSSSKCHSVKQPPPPIPYLGTT
jgi:hypothetical protein